MPQAQPCRVQMVSAIAGQRRGLMIRQWTGHAAGHIQGFADQRVAGSSQVDADLMRTAGRDLNLNQ